MKVILGKNPQIHKSAILGLTPGRKIALLPTVIGDNARLRSHTVIYTNVRIGNDLETGHNVVIREENLLGNNVSIWSNSVVDYGCRLGNNVRIHTNVYLAQYTEIGDDVFVAPGVTTVNDPHPICTKCMKGPLIKQGARIGANATLLSHIVIGEYALVGAGSVVTRDVPPRTVVYGNPAQVVGTVDDLKCWQHLVDKPYQDGLDVLLRERLGVQVLKEVRGERDEDPAGGPESPA